MSEPEQKPRARPLPYRDGWTVLEIELPYAEDVHPWPGDGSSIQYPEIIVEPQP